MIRSINIFKSINPEFFIRVEFWDTDKLVEIYEVKVINVQLLNRIENFIRG